MKDEEPLPCDNVEKNFTNAKLFVNPARARNFRPAYNPEPSRVQTRTENSNRVAFGGKRNEHRHAWPHEEQREPIPHRGYNRYREHNRGGGEDEIRYRQRLPTSPPQKDVWRECVTEDEEAVDVQSVLQLQQHGATTTSEGDA
uniref:Catalase n=1 Tax=Lygus hesperus TaxID=30085 RepID=A0A0A9ZH51_LYGHE